MRYISNCEGGVVAMKESCVSFAMQHTQIVDTIKCVFLTVFIESNPDKRWKWHKTRRTIKIKKIN